VFYWPVTYAYATVGYRLVAPLSTPDFRLQTSQHRTNAVCLLLAMFVQPSGHATPVTVRAVARKGLEFTGNVRSGETDR
jgi:hypothetical protein